MVVEQRADESGNGVRPDRLGALGFGHRNQRGSGIAVDAVDRRPEVFHRAAPRWVERWGEVVPSSVFAATTESRHGTRRQWFMVSPEVKSALRPVDSSLPKHFQSRARSPGVSKT
ncbi:MULTISPECIES: hypothetical protein [Mycobacterium avium complex (MAC)]|uniref:hypothetical protein n=1 Tax=Mycobacterium avium complex (MAC) TaxID=120793 RepID=UPI00030E1980|nr:MULTISPECIES: hypothetical protein [Mycobacterium avium complex (MAC)]